MKCRVVLKSTDKHSIYKKICLRWLRPRPDSSQNETVKSNIYIILRRSLNFKTKTVYELSFNEGNNALACHLRANDVLVLSH